MTIYVATESGVAGQAHKAIKANGASKPASRLQDEIVWRSRRAAEIVARGGEDLKGKGAEALGAAHEQLDRATAVAGKASRKLAEKGRQTAYTVRKHPVQTTLVAASLGLGLALLLNERARGTVLRVSRNLWDDYGSIAFPLLTAIAIPSKPSPSPRTPSSPARCGGRG